MLWLERIFFWIVKVKQINWSERSACAAPGHYCGTKFPLYYFGPNRVRALPLSVAAERSFFFLSFLSPPCTFLPKGVVLEFWNYKQVTKKTWYWVKKFVGTPLAPWGAIFQRFPVRTLKNREIEFEGPKLILSDYKISGWVYPPIWKV